MREYDENTRFWITDKGRRDLLDSWAETFECQHSWDYNRPGVLVCMVCGAEHRITRASGQAASVKRRSD